MPTAKKTTKTAKKPKTKTKIEKKKIKKFKKTDKKTAVKPKETAIKPKAKPARYFEAVGRRKTSGARVRLFTQGEKILLINGKPIKEYFPDLEIQQIAISALEKMKCLDHFNVSIKVRGGGIHSQSEAIKHGISRALVKFNPDFRKRLRKAGYITRDPRERERKKFGLKRARRAPQWSKR